MLNVYIFTLFNEAWLMYAMYNTMFSKYGASGLIVSMLFAASQVTKVGFDIVFGFLMPHANRKCIFIWSCFARAFAVLLWILYPCQESFFIGMMLVGVHMSAFFQHFEGYIYDVNRDKEGFSKALGKYYAVMNLSIFLTSSFLNYFNQISINTVLMLQLFISIIGATFAIWLPSQDITSKTKDTLLSVIKYALKLPYKNTIIILAIVEGLFMSFASMISVLAEHYSSQAQIAAKLLMLITIAKIPINYIAGYVKVKNPVFASVFAIILSIPLFLLGGSYGLIGIVAYFMLYTISVVHIYNRVHKDILPSYRMTIATIITILTSCFTVVYDMIIGLFSPDRGVVANLSIAILGICIVQLLLGKFKTTSAR